MCVCVCVCVCVCMCEVTSCLKKLLKTYKFDLEAVFIGQYSFHFSLVGTLQGKTVLVGTV